VVTVNVSDGKETESFPVIRRFICSYSPYFRVLFNRRQQAGETPEIDFEEQPEVFSLFVNWVYLHYITRDSGLKWDLPDINSLFRLWILGGKIRSARLRREVMEIILSEEGYVGATTYETMAYVYANTESGCPLRKVLVDRASLGDLHSVGMLFRELDVDPARRLPPAMMAEMLMAYNYRLSLAAKPIRHRRTYKEIADGAPKLGRKRPQGVPSRVKEARIQAQAAQRGLECVIQFWLRERPLTLAERNAGPRQSTAFKTHPASSTNPVIPYSLIPIHS
jgi:hypothetical protein